MLSFITGNYTDLYQLTMGEVHLLEKRAEIPVCFDYFYRRIPNNGGYVVFAGLENVLDVLENLQFSPEDIAFLKTLSFHPKYIDFLERFRFTGRVVSVQEGEVVFPNCPILRIEGGLFEVQLVETMLLNILNFQSLIATKASRMHQVAAGRELSEFGFRRAHGPGGVLATRAAIVGGFQTTSNVYAAEQFGLKTSGTMAHSFIESYDDELQAFRAYASTRPGQCIFLVDTYDTLKSGVPNAITVAREMEGRGERAVGVRLDSGDLAWLSKTVRQMLDQAGLHYMKIVVSNQLDEYVIRSLLQQDAPIDVFGVGTRLVTGHPDAALDGVYKMATAEGRPTIKLSDTLQKVTLPGLKQVMRIIDEQGQFFGADAILLQEEKRAERIYHPFETDKFLDVGHLEQEALLAPVMEAGKRSTPRTDLSTIADYSLQRLRRLPLEYRRFENPHVYKTSLSKSLRSLRDDTWNAHRHKLA